MRNFALLPRQILSPNHFKLRRNPPAFLRAESACIFVGGKRRQLWPSICFANVSVHIMACPSCNLPADSALQNQGDFRRHFSCFSAARCLYFLQALATIFFDVGRRQTGCDHSLRSCLVVASGGLNSNLDWGSSHRKFDDIRCPVDLDLSTRAQGKNCSRTC